MASPQDVIEVAIPHPADSTPDSRRRAAQQVIAALQINSYYFVRRQTPVLDRDDGQCPHCKCELVHVDMGPAYDKADAIIHAQRQRIAKLETALQRIADGTGTQPQSIAQAALY